MSGVRLKSGISLAHGIRIPNLNRSLIPNGITLDDTAEYAEDGLEAGGEG